MTDTEEAEYEKYTKNLVERYGGLFDENNIRYCSEEFKQFERMHKEAEGVLRASDRAGYYAKHSLVLITDSLILAGADKLMQDLTDKGLISDKKTVEEYMDSSEAMREIFSEP